MAKKGKLIVIDGTDGSGKATQVELLAKALKKDGYIVKLLDFPEYYKNFFGKFIGHCLSVQYYNWINIHPKIAAIAYAADRWESSDKIREWLQKGYLVLANRYVSANQIHQGGKIPDENERASFLEWLDRMEHEVLKIQRPNLIIYLRVPVEISLELLLKKRATKNQSLGVGVKDTVEEDRTYLERSHETANWLAMHQPNWRVIDCAGEGGMRTIEDIQSDVRRIVDEVVKG